MPGYFPGDPSLMPPAAPTAPGIAMGDSDSAEDAAALVAETRLLRQQMEILVSELRLLRSVISGEEPSAATLVPAPMPLPPPQAVSPAPAPAPIAFQQPSTFPVASPVSRALPVDAPMPAPAPATVPPPSFGAARGSVARVVSAGYDAGNLANIYADGHKIPISDGEEDRRGLNVVIINPSTGRVISAKPYDIWGNPFAEGKRFSAEVDATPDGHVLIVALKDSGLENADDTILRTLRSIGSTLLEPLAMREGYALIGVKNGAAIAERRGRDAEIEGVLPFTVQRSLSTPSPAAPTPVAAPAAWPAVAPFDTFGGAAAAEPASTTGWEQGGTSEEDGQTWEEVLLMLDKLQADIQAKRLERKAQA